MNKIKYIQINTFMKNKVCFENIKDLSSQILELFFNKLKVKKTAQNNAMIYK